MTTTATTTKPQIEAFVEKLNAKFPRKNFGVMYGRKNARVITLDTYGRTAWCFIRLEDGAIFKCDGWKAPAKGVRAWLTTVLAEDLATVDEFTGWLYRGR